MFRYVMTWYRDLTKNGVVKIILIWSMFLVKNKLNVDTKKTVYG